MKLWEESKWGKRTVSTGERRNGDSFLILVWVDNGKNMSLNLEVCIKTTEVGLERWFSKNICYKCSMYILISLLSCKAGPGGAYIYYPSNMGSGDWRIIGAGWLAGLAPGLVRDFVLRS